MAPVPKIFLRVLGRLVPNLIFLLKSAKWLPLTSPVMQVNPTARRRSIALQLSNSDPDSDVPLKKRTRVRTVKRIDLILSFISIVFIYAYRCICFHRHLLLHLHLVIPRLWSELATDWLVLKTRKKQVFSSISYSFHNLLTVH